MSRYVVLGAGRVGGLIARDLAADPDAAVLLADRDPAALARHGDVARLSVGRADLADPAEVARLAAGADVVVSAVPGFLGHRVLRAAVEAGRPVADIAFGPEDPLALDAAARARGVAAVVDCGVAPGLSNLLAGRSAAELERTDAIDIVVGGLPAAPTWPYGYRSVFSPTDVVEEYTRPARIREHGVEVERPALSGLDLVDLPGVGTLEAFLTDGLRTLLTTLDVPNLRERTLRWPGHAERMRMLRETGFFADEPIVLEGARVRPRALAEALLFEAWRPREGEEEFTVLRVVVDGEDARGRVRLTWDLLDRTDRATGATSMARTTGFPCAVAARLLARGGRVGPGVHPPEVLGRDEALTREFLAALAARGVAVQKSVSRSGSATSSRSG